MTGANRMTITIERFADYRHARALAGTTFFERNDELTGTLMRGQHPEMRHSGSTNGVVLLCLDIDHEGFARVEVEPSRSLGLDTLATAELALTHLQVVCDRLRTFAAIEAGV
jgi:hypothetical protein